MKRFLRPWGASAALLFPLLFAACGDSSEGETTAPAGGSFRITASGEELALTGYAFPPKAGQEVVVVDGWEVKFEKVLVAVQHVDLHATPDLSPTDQSQTGPLVATLAGPWVLDLAKNGDGTVAGKESGIRAWVLGTLEKQADGAAFSATDRYAVSYAVGKPTGTPTFLGATGTDPDVKELLAQGYSHLFVGTATLRAGASECRDSGVSGFDPSTLPKVVKFRFGLDAAVAPKNCQNPELSGTPLGQESAPRGVQARVGEPVDVQLTFHLDHLFWPGVDESSAPIFNHYAALAKPQADGSRLVTVEELDGVAVAPVKVGSQALGWTSCVPAADYTLPTSPRELTLDTEGNADLQHVGDVLAFNVRTMAHLNQDGICFVDGAAHSHSP